MCRTSPRLENEDETSMLGDDFLHHMPVHVGEAEITTRVAEGEFFVIETELVEDGGMQVAHLQKWPADLGWPLCWFLKIAI